MKFRCMIVMIGVVLTFALIGMGAMTPNYGGVLKIGITQEILNLDPHVATAFSSFRVIENIYEGLLRYDQDMKLQPCLAESWTVSPDGTEYLFRLRPGVKFHDGSGLTAEDVKYSLERILSPKTKSPQASRLAVIKEITVVNPLEVKITLKEPYAPFLAVLAMPGVAIVPHDFETRVKDPKTETDGTGPFKLAEFGSDYVKLVKNPDYWGQDAQGNQLPYLDGILFKVVPAVTTLRAAIQTSEIDLIFGFGVDVTTIGTLKNVAGLRILSVPELAYSLLGIQDSRPPFNDVRVRQAISLAIDRQQIVDVVYSGYAQVAGPVPPSLTDWNPLPPSQLPNYTRNVQEAKELLSKAGYPKGISFKIMPIPTVPDALKIAQVIQEQLKEANIRTEIESVDFATFLHRWRNSDFDTFVSLNGGSVDPDIHLYRHLFSNGTTNVFKYNDPVTDYLLKAGRIATDHATRLDIYTALQRRISEQVPFIFLTYSKLFAVERNTVHGFVLMPTRSITSLRQTYMSKRGGTWNKRAKEGLEIGLL